MNLVQTLWNDEAGAILSAETVMIGSVAVMGAAVGWNATADAVNGELTEFSKAIRSLDQSYVVAGHRSCNAWTAGSYYIQPAPADTEPADCATLPPQRLQDLRDQIDNDRRIITPAVPTPAAPSVPPAPVPQGDDA